AAGGKTMLLGAPFDTMTLLHHADHLAAIPGKRIRHHDAPIIADGRRVWRRLEAFDTTEPVVAGLPDAYFATVLRDFLPTGRRRLTRRGAAQPSSDADEVPQGEGEAVRRVRGAEQAHEMLRDRVGDQGQPDAAHAVGAEPAAGDPIVLGHAPRADGAASRTGRR